MRSPFDTGCGVGMRVGVGRSGHGVPSPAGVAPCLAAGGSEDAYSLAAPSAPTPSAAAAAAPSAMADRGPRPGVMGAPAVPPPLWLQDGGDGGRVGLPKKEESSPLCDSHDSCPGVGLRLVDMSSAPPPPPPMSPAEPQSALEPERVGISLLTHCCCPGVIGDVLTGSSRRSWGWRYKGPRRWVGLGVLGGPTVPVEPPRLGLQDKGSRNRDDPGHGGSSKTPSASP